MADLWCFDVHGGIGKAALYTVPDSDPTDDSPLTSPRSHLSRVRFHTDFKYPQIVADTTYSLELPARTNNTRGEQTHTLGAHGRGGTPFCFGAYYFQGGWAPLFVSSPVTHTPAAVNARPKLCRLISLGADATNLLLHEYYCVENSFSATAVTISVRVLVTTELL